MRTYRSPNFSWRSTKERHGRPIFGNFSCFRERPSSKTCSLSCANLAKVELTSKDTSFAVLNYFATWKGTYPKDQNGRTAALKAPSLPGVVRQGDIVVAIDESSANKGTEYRQKKAMEFPSLNLLLGEVRELRNQISSHVAVP